MADAVAIAVAIAEVRPASVTMIQGAETVTAALGRALGLPKDPKAARAWRRRGTRLLPTGPGQWLAASDELDPAAIDAALAGALSETDATWVDLTHGRTVLAVEGEQAVEVLATGCPLDLDAAPADFAAASLLGPFSVVLHRAGKTRWELYVFSSLAGSCLEWLEEAAGPLRA